MASVSPHLPTGTAHSHAFVFGNSHSAGILRMYEEWNKDPLKVADCMERHGFVDTKKYVMNFLNTGSQFNWEEAKVINPAMMTAFSHLTMSICDMIESGNRVAIRLMMSGFHVKPYQMPGVHIEESGEFFRSYAMLTFQFGPTGKMEEVHMLTNILDTLREGVNNAASRKASNASNPRGAPS